MKKIGLFICSFDGIATRHSGVGTATFGYLSAATRLNKELAKSGYEIICHALTNKYDPKIHTYNPTLLESVKKICNKLNGEVHFCINDSDGNTHFGEIQNWNCVSASAASKIIDIIEKNDFELAIILGVDTPYAFAPIYVKKQYKGNTKIIGVFVPHSTSLIHERGNYDLHRLEWELKCISEINKTENLYVSYLNKFMYDHLNIDYGATEESLTPLLNGVNFDEIVYYSQQEIEKDLQKYKIPTDKKIMFMYGRGAWYKGFDLFLEAAKKLDLPVHYVIQASPYSPHEQIEEKVTEAAKDLANCTLIFEYSFDLPRKVMQWHNTVLTAVPSRYEPGAFIPAEIRVYGNSICMVSNKDGLPCQVKDEVDGFICDIGSIDNIADCMKEIYQLDEETRDKILIEGKNLIKKEYDIQKNFINGINLIITKSITHKG